jgi:Tol biopolymer transport system component/thiol-disulfide isomerase/thioredoxin
MPDLDERFRGVDRVPVPDQWASIETRQVHSDLPSARRRVGVVVLALALSIATTAVAIVAFDRVGDDRTVSTQTIANGLILYTALGPSPDGSKFDNVDLFSFDPATGERTNLTQTPLAAEGSVVWSADKTKVAFQRTQVGDRGSSMVVVAGADLSVQRIIKTCNEGCSLDMAWSPDDGWIAWTGERRLDGGNYVETLELYDLASGTTSVICDSRSCGFPGQPAWSPDGSRIAFSGAGAYHLPGYAGPTGPIRIADVSSGAVTTLTGSGEPCNMERDGCASDTSPEWSPSGDSIAYVHEVRGGTSEATTQVMVVAADGSDPRVLSMCVSNDQCRQGPLAWSPDGRSVAFVDRYDHPVLHLLDPSGEGDVSIPLPPSAGSPFDLVWSPDGRQLAFLSGDSGAQLFLVDVDTRDVRAASEPLPGHSGGDLAWLPGSFTTASPEGSAGQRAAARYFFTADGVRGVLEVTTSPPSLCYSAQTAIAPAIRLAARSPISHVEASYEPTTGTFCDRTLSAALARDLIDSPAGYMIEWRPDPSGPLRFSPLAIVISGTTLGGQEIDPAALTGKTLVVGLWASWCQPCQGELEELQQISDIYAGDDHVVVLGVNLDQDVSEAVMVADELGVTFDSIADGQELADALGANGAPATFVIDGQGRIVASFLGASRDAGDSSSLASQIAAIKNAVEAARAP